MTAISIAVAIPHIPSHRTSSNEVEGGLFSSFTREQFEMQEASEWAVITLLVQYKTVQKVYLSPSWKRRESWKKNPKYREEGREIQRLEKEVRVKSTIKSKQHKEKYTPSDFQINVEINDSDTEMQT